MKQQATRSLASFVAACSIITLSAQIHAETFVLNRTVVTDASNRPFFSQAAFPAIVNDAGYVGTATPGATSSSTVTRAAADLGGNSTPLDAGNDVPMGVGLDFGVSFTVETVNSANLLTDAGNPGLGVSSAGESGTNLQRLNANETLHFSPIAVTAVTVYDPLGLLVPGTTTITNLLWRSLRQNTNNVASSPTVTVSSDAAGANVVGSFSPAGPSILNDTPGQFTPTSEIYVNTTAGAWPLKGIGYQMELNYTLATPPPTRRMFYFGDPAVTYNGTPTHQITTSDTTVTISAVGDASAVLDTNSLGVGVNSAADDLTDGLPTSNNRQRFIDGALSTPEALHISFDRDVSLESLTLGNLDLDGSEGVVLKFVSGTNPFSGLTGYSGDYTLGADSLTYATDDGGQTPYTFTFGKNGQDELLVEAGTILSLTANPVNTSGFLLDMITVHVPEAVVPDADFDNDGQVDADDLATWQTNFGSTTATDMTGDADGDGDADGADFLQWQQELGPAPGSSAIPEPATAVLIAAAMSLIGFGRKSRC